MSTDSDDSLPSEPTFLTLINVTVTTDAIDQRSRRTAEDQICQVIGITAHSRLGCKDDASPRRHRFKFIFLKLSFYIIFSKIPIKTSIKYLATQSRFSQFLTFLFYLNPQFLGLSLPLPNKPKLSHNIITKSIFRIERYNDRPTDIADRSHHQTLCYGQYSKPVLAFGTERVKEYDNKDFQL